MKKSIIPGLRDPHERGAGREGGLQGAAIILDIFLFLLDLLFKFLVYFVYISIRPVLLSY